MVKLNAVTVIAIGTEVWRRMRSDFRMREASCQLLIQSFAPVAQRIARPPPKGQVTGSSPVRGANKIWQNMSNSQFVGLLISEGGQLTTRDPIELPSLPPVSFGPPSDRTEVFDPSMRAPIEPSVRVERL